MNIYIGNMPYSMSENDLDRAFSSYGAVDSVRLVTDRDTGRPKGFGFVEMHDTAEAQAAIAGLNGSSHDSRTIVVNEARPREERTHSNNGFRRSGNRY
ncbi:RNA-binding protein [Victivallis sp. Marseille-Q1083]|uniref:RNA recognition motif domain-containing protein n=1 Tax=Victivallis sp. Marseille-Q1083 TaxID=2717288 RepID=UPI0026DDB7E1|nr:RNA-binding protein [Victivallis sp. Marseille-Q1083]